MWPARARGLAKRREQSLHVFLAMERGRELGELDERERERERSGELKIRAFGGEGKRENCPPLPPWGS
jgi:hypothetical protein